MSIIADSKLNMLDTNLPHRIALSLIPQIGVKTARTLIAYTGSAEAVFKENAAALLKIPGIGQFTADKIISHRADALARAYDELKFIEKHNIRPIFYTDEAFPFLLKQTEDAPLILYIQGDINFVNRKMLSIVGTRKATNYGKGMVEELVKYFAKTDINPIIVSGLAYGIDIHAHRTALKFGLDTVAVLGHGFDRIYPDTHGETAEQIRKSGGALMTEYLSFSRFDRQNFLQRNRIIAGLSEATLVAESGDKGGSLVTAELANSYNREVFAIPGRVGDANSAGCNSLIKKHKAYMIESAVDIEYILGWNTDLKKQVVQNQLFIEFSEDEKLIVKAIKEQDKPVIDQICKLAQLPPAKVSALLLELEFKGVVRNLPGKIFELSGNFNLS